MPRGLCRAGDHAAFTNDFRNAFSIRFSGLHHGDDQGV